MTTTPGKPRKLTEKQERFIIEYAKDFKATDAARRAGYTGKCLNRTASQLLDLTRQIMVDRGTLTKPGTGIASLEQTLKLCTAMAFHDSRRLFNQSGQCVEVPELSRRDALMIAGFKIDDLFEMRADGEGKEKVGVTRDYKIADRMPYVNMLLKYHGAFPVKRPEIPNDVPQGSLPWQSLSLEDRLELRETIAKFIEEKSAAKTIEGPKVVNVP